MARNEHTSKKVATIASKILLDKPVSKKDVKSVAASVLTQTPNKKKSK
jgi:hypothetical protein